MALAAALCSLALFGVSCGPKPAPNVRDVERLEAAKKDIQDKSWLSAIRCLDEAICNDPKLAEAYLLRGTAINEYIADSLAKRQFPKDYSRKDALRDLDQALRLQPNCGDAHFQRGYALAGLAEVAEARAAFGQAIPFLNDPTQAYVERAGLAFHQGDYRAAVQDMTEAINRNPLEPDYYETRSMYRRVANEFRDSRFDKAKAKRLRENPDVTLADLKKLEQDTGDYQPISTAQNAKKVLTEKMAFNGKWQVVSNDSGGHFQETEDRDFSFTFSPEGYTLVLDWKLQQKAKFRLDVATKPRKIDLDGNFNGEAATAYGIYEFQGSTLQINLSRPGEARPTNFTTEGQMRTLYTLKRLDPGKQQGNP
jgi:uncharacterized protein (TIGR03067 family)